MDRSLSFFIDVAKSAANADASNFGVKAVNRNYTTTTQRVNRDGRVVSTTSENSTYTLYPSAFSEYAGDDRSRKFINYRGVSGTNEFDTLTTSRQEQSDTSITSIVAWSRQYPAAQLRNIDFAYLKDIGVHHANRMVVLRRFGDGAAPDDLLSGRATLIPTNTVVSYIKPDTKTALDISFNENWKTNSKDGLINVVNDVLGQFSLGGGKKVSALPSFDGLSNLGQAIASRVGKAMGLVNQDVNILGDPNVIHEAAYREAAFDGLKCDFSITVEAEYVQNFIDGIDEQAAMMDIIANIVAMGTSESKFVITGDGTDKIQGLINKVMAGDVAGLVNDIIDAVSGVLKAAVEKVTGFIKEAAQDPSKAADSLVSGLYSEAVSLIREAVGKYTWRLRGAVGAMSGAPTAPWHVTMGNPKAPWFSCGNLVCTSVKLELSNGFMRNDYPEYVKATYTLKPARNRGAQEITSLFNAGKGRIYHVPSNKTKIVVVE